jgi:hypothetical protein
MKDTSTPGVATSGTSRRTGLVAAGATAAAILAAGIIAVVPGFGPERERGRDHEKSRKTWSGKSYAAQTAVATAPAGPSATAPGFDSEMVWSGEDDWEPAVAVDPVNPDRVYQLTTRYSGARPCNNCSPNIIFRRSDDGGATWGADSFLIVTRKAQNDPQIEVATSGHVYAAWLDSYNPGVSFIRSMDFGATWTARINFTGKGKKPSWSDKPWLAMSADGQHVYIAFNASDSYVVNSHNFGSSFSNAVKTNNDTRYWFHSGGVVSPSNPNTVWFAAADYSQTYAGPANINVLKSTDGGATWTRTIVDTSAEMPDCEWADGCFLGFFGPSIALAIDSAGKLLIAYNAGDVAGGPQKMWARTSTDGGATWSARQELSNGSSTVNNAFPAAAAGPTAGDFRVVWQDDRNQSRTGWNTWYRRTTNGGSTWGTALQLSDLTSGAPYKNAAGYKFPYGDYFEMAVDSSGRNHILWGEGDSYTGPGGTWYTRGQ